MAGNMPKAMPTVALNANAMITAPAAFRSTGVNVAVADGDGDGKAAAAGACPAGLVPTPHIAAA